MWELDCEESRALKIWCFWTAVLEKTLESPLDCKEIQPVHSKGDQPWDFFGRTDAEAETPILWLPHAKSWLVGKDWFWEGLGAGEGDNRGWDGWMASLTWWTWVWVNSGSWWWTVRPGVLQFMGLPRVGHDWVNGLNWRLRQEKWLVQGYTIKAGIRTRISYAQCLFCFLPCYILLILQWSWSFSCLLFNHKAAF